MTPAQVDLIECILDSREVPDEVQRAIDMLMKEDQEVPGMVTKEQATDLILTLLRVECSEDASYRVGGILHR